MKHIGSIRTPQLTWREEYESDSKSLVTDLNAALRILGTNVDRNFGDLTRNLIRDFPILAGGVIRYARAAEASESNGNSDKRAIITVKHELGYIPQNWVVLRLYSEKKTDGAGVRFHLPILREASERPFTETYAYFRMSTHTDPMVVSGGEGEEVPIAGCYTVGMVWKLWIG